MWQGGIWHLPWLVPKSSRDGRGKASYCSNRNIIDSYEFKSKLIKLNIVFVDTMDHLDYIKTKLLQFSCLIKFLGPIQNIASGTGR